MVIPGTLPGPVSELLDAMVADMREAHAQASAATQDLVAAEARLATLESQVRVLTAAVVALATAVAPTPPAATST